MKKIILRTAIALIITVFISSCGATHSGYMTNSAALSSANFSYLKQNINGEATATYVLGIGGLAKETLVDNAKQKMLENNPLKSNQTFANLTVNFKSSYYLGLFGKVKCTVTADIVEFK
ncbi:MULTISPECIES: DUF6567 family protein [unclassified Flavobacterium]|jgi:hypothetical protein|uniref:DUF6567 family protein n=1 Tax=unclassified Flavobacterium TaxID=196869 RepID=UPI0025C2A7F6|nr:MULTISPECIES: DUF6567 family protein [unclassified Flavobacterium]